MKREDEGRLPALPLGDVPPCRTSLSAWAPKLSLLANDGLGGELIGPTLSSSSITAPSSKLFRNSGDPLAVVDMLARLCLEKALKGESPPPADPDSPNAIDMLFLLFGALADTGTGLGGAFRAGGMFVVLLKARGFNISTKDLRRWVGEGGTPLLLSLIVAVFKVRDRR